MKMKKLRKKKKLSSFTFIIALIAKKTSLPNLMNVDETFLKRLQFQVKVFTIVFKRSNWI